MISLSFNAYFNWVFNGDESLFDDNFKVLKKRIEKQKLRLENFLFFPMDVDKDVHQHKLYFFNEKWFVTLSVSKEYDLVISHQSLEGINNIDYEIKPHGHRVLKARKDNNDLFEIKFKGAWPSALKKDYQSRLDEIHELITD